MSESQEFPLKEEVEGPWTRCEITNLWLIPGQPDLRRVITERTGFKTAPSENDDTVIILNEREDGTDQPLNTEGLRKFLLQIRQKNSKVEFAFY